MFITFYRVLKTAFKNFWRNSWLSLATIGIMIITLLIISSLVIINVIADSALLSLQDKIDISVYFNLNTSEQEILKTKTELLNLPEIKDIEYISREQAVVNFTEKHKGNNLLLESLAELDENPLEATLNIKAQQASMYSAILTFLDQKYSSIISKVRADKNVIEKFNNITGTLRKTGFILSAIFAVLAVLITFNTIRLAIYTYKREVEIMRLVGASNWYIRWPFIIEGILYGIFGVWICVLILYLVVRFISPKIIVFLPEMNLLSYFHSHLWLIIGMQLLIAIGLGVTSSFIAIRRYLKV
ncbi:hypothetical protein CL633_01795 [bacterium]|nr:hypothetical protein [bacterium]|tara:strand:- start:3239 stop:4138 length:900 start_codon:yes stop_codon:yes gene_type:complete